MGYRRSNRKSSGLSASINTAVWMLGLAFIAWTDSWWPGILVLVALTTLLNGFLGRDEADDRDVEVPAAPVAEASIPIDEQQSVEDLAPAAPQYRYDLLPAECKQCGGPIRGHDAQWTSETSADCPYCGANLALASAA